MELSGTYDDANADMSVSGVILCGGAGSRLGGADKPLLPVNGAPMVEHVMTAMVPCVDDVMISCNRNLDRYSEYGHQIVVDEVVNRGPLEGLRCALLNCRNDQLLCAPGDSPSVSVEVFERLLTPVSGASKPLVKVAFDGHRQQNLFCLMHRSVLPVVEAQLLKDERSISTFLERCEAVSVDCSDLASCFVNINHPSDIEGL